MIKSTLGCYKQARFLIHLNGILFSNLPLACGVEAGRYAVAAADTAPLDVWLTVQQDCQNSGIHMIIIGWIIHWSKKVINITTM